MEPHRCILSWSTYLEERLTAAFSHFQEPYAWLIRGLVEYGWPDISQPGTPIPHGTLGGIQLADLVRSGGAHGLLLEIPARRGDEVCLEDGQYSFRVHLQRQSGHIIFVLRCPEANYFQEFEFDPENPTWAAGYMHQALHEYIPSYVTWRLQGGELSWAERAGIPEVDTESASELLLTFVRERVNRNLSFDLGPSEGWWPLQAHGDSPHWQGGSVARMGKGAGEPLLVRKKGQLRLSTQDEQRIRREALKIIDLPGSVLIWLSATHILGGTVWFANGIYAFLADTNKVGDVKLALQVSFTLGILAYGLGTVSILGARRYKRLIEHKMVFISFLFVAVMPCFYIWICLWLSWWMAVTLPIWIGGGLVVTIWAWRIWRSPLIRQARALENAGG